MPHYRTYILKETGSPRNQAGILIETSQLANKSHSDTGGGGHYLNVKGTVLTDMTYLTKPPPSSPCILPTFEEMYFVGTVIAASAYSAIELIDGIYRSVEVPDVQLNLNGLRKKEKVQLRKCRE